MGITTVAYNDLRTALDAANIHPAYRMCELGNQYLYFDPPTTIPHLTPAKGFFQKHRVEHVSLDINGQDGALPVDLRRPVPDELGLFDVVTDFGVLEHVGDPYAVLGNCHALCRPGGLMIHILPMTGHWPGHGVSYARPDTFPALCRAAGYDLIFNEVKPCLGNAETGMQVHAAFTKRGNPLFPSVSELIEGGALFEPK